MIAVEGIIPKTGRHVSSCFCTYWSLLGSTDRPWGLCPQTPEIFRFTANGIGHYAIFAAMEDKALLRSNLSAMAGPYGTGGAIHSVACFIIAVGLYAINLKLRHIVRLNCRSRRFNSFHGSTPTAAISRGLRCLGHFPRGFAYMLDPRSTQDMI